eukprot:SAG22_NODE_9067_length_611_cov_1.708984_1_plen_27_part_10
MDIAALGLKSTARASTLTLSVWAHWGA